MRGPLAGEIARITRHEDEEQRRLRGTADFAEGTKASLERREPNFTGH
jgi:enoyl-CoA hydratase/carnithine racemase